MDSPDSNIGNSFMGLKTNFWLKLDILRSYYTLTIMISRGWGIKFTEELNISVMIRKISQLNCYCDAEKESYSTVATLRLNKVTF